MFACRSDGATRPSTSRSHRLNAARRGRPVRVRMPTAATNTSDSPAATIAPIAADTQSKPVGGVGSRVIAGDATVVLSACALHERSSSYSFAAVAAIEDGGGGTADGSQVATGLGGSTTGLAEAAGAMIAVATASAASAAPSLFLKCIWTPFGSATAVCSRSKGSVLEAANRAVWARSSPVIASGARTDGTPRPSGQRIGPLGGGEVAARDETGVALPVRRGHVEANAVAAGPDGEQPRAVGAERGRRERVRRELDRRSDRLLRLHVPLDRGPVGTCGDEHAAVPCELRGRYPRRMPFHRPADRLPVCRREQVATAVVAAHEEQVAVGRERQRAREVSGGEPLDELACVRLAYFRPVFGLGGGEQTAVGAERDRVAGAAAAERREAAPVHVPDA